MSKILIVVESIDIENSSGSKANVALIKNLKRAGFQLLVYHYSFKEIHLDDISCVYIKEKKWSGYFLLSRIERQLRYIFKVKLYKPLENLFGFSFTLFNDRESIVSALSCLNNFEPDLVLTLSQGGRFRPHHALLKMTNLHKRWMAYIHDPYPMHLYPPPYPWKEPGFIKKEEFIKEMAEKAAVHAFPSKMLMEWMGSFYKEFLEKGLVIPHQLDEEVIVEAELPDYFNKKKFNIVHSGNLLWGRDPDGLIRGFVKFLEMNPEAVNTTSLIFLGGKNHYSKILNDCQSNLPQIYVGKNYVPFRESIAVQRNSSVNVILEAKADISPFLPGKFTHCVQANRPVLLLGPERSESRRLLGEDYLYWAEIDEVDKIAGHIGHLYQRWTEENRPLNLDCPDLKYYLSEDFLKEAINDTLERIEK